MWGPLGIWRELVAAFVVDMVARGELHAVSTKTALDILWVEFRNWSRNSGMTAPAGRLSMHTLGRSQSSTDYPELASSFKAVTVKSFVVFIAQKIGNLPCDGEVLRHRVLVSVRTHNYERLL